MDATTGKAVLSFLQTLVDLWRKIFPKKDKGSTCFDVPTRTIIVAPNADEWSCWWHMGSSAGKPAMQIEGQYNVTNITKNPVFLNAVKMKKPRHMGIVMVKDLESGFHGKYQIPPGCYTDMTFEFWVVPPFKEEGESFVADVAVLDQFGNEHWIRRVHFQYS